MRRWLLRFMGFSSIAAALLSILIDVIASSDRAETVFRPLGAFWLDVHDRSLQDLHTALTSDGPSMLWGGLLMPILSQPSIVVFGCLAVIFLALAWMMPRRNRRVEYDDHDFHERNQRREAER